ncbi:MAG: hypothetical protein QOD57_3718 [Actinomycetota bacterium]|jgi:hypothetical protein|nr:hypothetical protein [Actinomycetota bacterium]MDQ1498329.1 hypothetical protein [Actinomycetota bacterium]MDQ1505991.1 hypothetical protein [Actinomycetota bacterium]
MRNGAKVLEGRLRGWTRGQDTEQGPGSGTADRDPAPHESLSSGGSSATGQLIDMGDWRLLPPVDSAVGGAA